MWTRTTCLRVKDLLLSQVGRGSPGRSREGSGTGLARWNTSRWTFTSCDLFHVVDLKLEDNCLFPRWSSPKEKWGGSKESGRTASWRARAEWNRPQEGGRRQFSGELCTLSFSAPCLHAGLAVPTDLPGLLALQATPIATSGNIPCWFWFNLKCNM